MLISDKNIKGDGLFVPLHEINIDQCLNKEWLLTNNRGGYSCSTSTGCNTRRYHGLLTGSLNPPANRIVALANLYETVTIDGQEYNLDDFEFLHHYPDKPEHLKGFHKELGAHFEYQFGSIEITKSIYMMPDADVVAIVYEFSDVFDEIKFSARPLVSLRDFHHLKRAADRKFDVELTDQGVTIEAVNEDTGNLLMNTSEMWFEESEQWWNEFMYRKEKERGQDCIDDTFSPGVFNCTIDTSKRIVLWASFGTKEDIANIPDFEIDTVIDALKLEQKELTAKTRKKNDDTLALLNMAADQFVVERTIKGKKSSTILAGFPWFLDWGRDTFISLPGLLLATERYKKAASVLTTFANAVDKGMIPNRFDDYDNSPHYNSIDASLWFVHSAFEYYKQSGDRDTFSQTLMPAIAQIVKYYHDGTRDNIHADEDGLISGGDPDTQLTWMDAKCGGVTFTPRYGKAVEVNALWYNALCSLADYLDQKEGHYEYCADAATYHQMADKVKDSFCKEFWQPELGFLNDCILPDGTPDSSLRPNQTYAVSLPYSPLPIEMQKKVIEVVGENLLTPYGLRTLSPRDPRYCHYYAGQQFDRDRAYHQGTVWPHLIGPFIEGWLRVHSFNSESREQAKSFLAPLIEHLKHDGCLGNISEIFDAEPPHNPRGCFAQAWAVAEVLRCYKLINGM